MRLEGRGTKKGDPLPGPPTVPQTQLRSNGIKNEKQKAVTITRQGSLGTMEELDNMNEAGIEEEVPATIPRRSQRQVAFKVASKRE